MVKRKKAWRLRSTEDIKRRLSQEETAYILGKVIGQIETPSKVELKRQRNFIRRILRKILKDNLPKPDDAIIRRHIYRLRRKVKRMEEGKFHVAKDIQNKEGSRN